MSKKLRCEFPTIVEYGRWLGSICFLATGILAQCQIIDVDCEKTRTSTAAFDRESQSRVRKHEAWLKKHGQELGTPLQPSPDIDFSASNLASANFAYADLRYAKFVSADLTSADFYKTDLRNAVMIQVIDSSESGTQCVRRTLLNGAVLVRTEMAGMRLEGADVAHAVLEPASLPNAEEMASVVNLHLVTYISNPSPLVQLRKNLRDVGLTHAADSVTYALRRRSTEIERQACWPGSMRSWPLDRLPAPLALPLRVEAAHLSQNGKVGELALHCTNYIFNRVALDLPCQYGMNKTRPVWIGVVIWLVCSLIFLLFIHHSGNSGIYLVWATGPTLDPDVLKKLVQLRPDPITGRGARFLLQWVQRELKLLSVAMLFSIVNAFNLGFKDVDFGRWLRMLSPREFELRAVGWVRTIAGIQALLTFYLVALWLITAFSSLLD